MPPPLPHKSPTSGLTLVVRMRGFSQAQFRSSEEISDSGIIDFTNHLFSEENFHDEQGKRKVHGRIVRSILDSPEIYIGKLEQLVIDSCIANGQTDAEEKLQPVFDKMMDCIRKNKLFITPKEEFLTSVEECSRDSIEKSKKCLPENQQYLPDMLLAQAQSTVKFTYNNYDTIRVDLVKCLPNLKKPEVLNSYLQCLYKIRGSDGGQHPIPTSKAEFCQKFVRSSYCFTNMIKENCDRTPGLAKYREEYVKSHKEPCEENETV